jgi:hypothetical protein
LFFFGSLHGVLAQNKLEARILKFNQIKESKFVLKEDSNFLNRPLFHFHVLPNAKYSTQILKLKDRQDNFLIFSGVLAIMLFMALIQLFYVDRVHSVFKNFFELNHKFITDIKILEIFIIAIFYIFVFSFLYFTLLHQFKLINYTLDDYFRIVFIFGGMYMLKLVFNSMLGYFFQQQDRVMMAFRVQTENTYLFLIVVLPLYLMYLSSFGNVNTLVLFLILFVYFSSQLLKFIKLFVNNFDYFIKQTFSLLCLYICVEIVPLLMALKILKNQIEI